MDVHEISAMSSPDGENVKFQPFVPCENGLENWLKGVEKAMRDTLKKNLQSCHN